MLLPNAHGALGQIQVHSPERGDFAPPQTHERGQQDQGAQPYHDQLGQLEDLGYRQDGTPRPVAPSPARGYGMDCVG
ncbi:hypothetical protein [Nonomuraea dietziae]|uniref:hypothetical protein n=1 Tax=Nonomuraea dietziae TaxID=65515 RepID=UPI0031E26B13